MEVTKQALYALEINNGFPKDVLDLCDDSFNNSENDVYTKKLFKNQILIKSHISGSSGSPSLSSSSFVLWTKYPSA